MKRIFAIVIAGLLLSFVVVANAEEKVVEKKIEPPTLKERVDNLEKRISRMETELNAQIDLSKEAITAAKQQLEEAKKFVDSKGKELDVEAALFKANHHLRTLKEFGSFGGMDGCNVKIVKLRKSIGMPGMKTEVFSDNDSDELPSIDEDNDYDIDVSPEAIKTQIETMQKDLDDKDGKVRVKVIAK